MKLQDAAACSRDKLRVNITDDSFHNTAGQSVYLTRRLGVNYYSAQYRVASN
jgi:hypothetical protein